MAIPRLLPIWLFLATLVVSGCHKEKAATPGAATGSLTDADRDSIRAYIARFDQKMMAGDISAVVAFYSDDAVLLPPNSAEVQGREAIRKFFQGLPKFTQFKQELEEVEGDENFAYPRGTFETTTTPPGSNKPVKDKGKVLAVWHKQEDGSWIVTRVIWNSDLAPAKR
jgi:uncharacterized protein (TIGR02246 family)